MDVSQWNRTCFWPQFNVQSFLKNFKCCSQRSRTPRNVLINWKLQQVNQFLNWRQHCATTMDPPCRFTITPSCTDWKGLKDDAEYNEMGDSQRNLSQERIVYVSPVWVTHKSIQLRAKVTVKFWIIASWPVPFIRPASLTCVGLPSFLWQDEVHIKGTQRRQSLRTETSPTYYYSDVFLPCSLLAGSSASEEKLLVVLLEIDISRQLLTSEFCNSNI